MKTLMQLVPLSIKELQTQLKKVIDQIKDELEYSGHLGLFFITVI